MRYFLKKTVKNGGWRKVQEFDSANAARIEMTIRQFLRDGHDYTITNELGESCVFAPVEALPSGLRAGIPYAVVVGTVRVASFGSLRRADAYVRHLFFDLGESEANDFSIAIADGILIRYRRSRNAGLEYYWANGKELPIKTFTTMA